jgi:putative flippase GtrA
MNYDLASLVSWTRTHQGRKLIRFTMTSVITTLVSLASIAVLYGFRIIPEVQWATLTGNVIGSFPAYHLNRRWTWGKRGRSHIRREIIPFWTLSILGIGFSQFFAWWAKYEVDTHQWSHLLNTALVTGANFISFAIFWVLKLMVFNRIFHVSVLEEMDEHLKVEEQSTGG